MRSVQKAAQTRPPRTAARALAPPAPITPITERAPQAAANPLWMGLAFRSGALRVQAKLTVGAPGDPFEREADAVADCVMRMPRMPQMPAGGSAPLIQRKCAGCAQEDEEKKGAVQAKETPGGVPLLTPDTAARIDGLRGGGEPLPQSTRSYFEPRFGADFSGVRIHTGAEATAAARDIRAQAFTFGRDIAFDRGRYAPSTSEGQRLLAHELTHVVQQGAGGPPATIRRKIKTDAQASLDGYFSKLALTGVTQTDGAYSHAKGGGISSEQEIPIDMLSSPRVFHVEGDNDADAASNLGKHVKARQGIVTFASNKKYKFAAGTSNFKMNPAYYDLDYNKGTWKVKPGVNKQEAWDDLNKNPEQYAIACDAATRITMSGGSGGATIIDIPSTDKDDWVPGDSGYIENTKFDGRVGLEGENLIYTGAALFWGHFQTAVTYRSLADWMKEVHSWNQSEKLDTKRELPATGLLDK